VGRRGGGGDPSREEISKIEVIMNLVPKIDAIMNLAPKIDAIMNLVEYPAHRDAIMDAIDYLVQRGVSRAVHDRGYVVRPQKRVPPVILCTACGDRDTRRARCIGSKRRVCTVSTRNTLENVDGVLHLDVCGAGYPEDNVEAHLRSGALLVKIWG
jgi:hypothetical protein